MKENDRLAGFRMLGPMGPCSTFIGIKLFAPNMADVGEMVLLSRTMGDACIMSAD